MRCAQKGQLIRRSIMLESMGFLRVEYVRRSIVLPGIHLRPQVTARESREHGHECDPFPRSTTRCSMPISAGHPNAEVLALRPSHRQPWFPYHRPGIFRAPQRDSVFVRQALRVTRLAGSGRCPMHPVGYRGRVTQSMHRFLPLAIEPRFHQFELVVPYSPNGKAATHWHCRQFPGISSTGNSCGQRHSRDRAGKTCQASLMIPLLLYTLGWLALVGADSFRNQFSLFVDSYARDPLLAFFWLSMLLIVVQILALWIPVLALRLVMGRAKAHFRKEADDLALHVREQKKILRSTSTTRDQKERAAMALEHALNAYRDHDDVPLWPISGTTLSKHLLHFWGLAAFLGISTSEGLVQKVQRVLADGSPVQIEVRNSSSLPLTLSYEGYSRCWERGNFPDESWELGPGEKSGPYESEALVTRCTESEANPYFTLWVATSEPIGGPIVIASDSSENCERRADMHCLRLLAAPLGIETRIERNEDNGVWTIEVLP